MSYIRIPLNGVVGFSQLIASEPNMDEDTRKEFSAIIQKIPKNWCNWLMTYWTCRQANMMKFQIQEYDAVALCNDAIYMARMRNEETIEIYFDTHIETQPITTDTGRLIQALVSTLTYPQKNTTHTKITFTLTRDVRQTDMFPHQQQPTGRSEFNSVSIRHDINRLCCSISEAATT